MIILDIREPHVDALVSHYLDLNKLCAELLVKVASGITYTGPGGSVRLPRKLGVTYPFLDKIDYSTKRIGRRVERKYQCTATGKYFPTQAECKRKCGSPKPRGRATGHTGREFASRSPKCALAEETVVHTYEVFFTFTVKIERIVLQWYPGLEHMPSAKRIVDRWNKAIVDHENDHAEMAKQAAARILPDMLKYEVRGETDADAENQLLGEIAADKTRFWKIFNDRMKRDGEKYHNVAGEGQPLPNFCR